MKLILFLNFFWIGYVAAKTERPKRHTMNACENLEFISGVEAIKFPRRYHSNFTRPWMRTDISAKLFLSRSLTYNFNWIKELKIRSLNVTLDEFMSFMDKHGCLFIPYGESVKDILLGSIKETSPLKLEGESTCDVFKVYDICRRKFGKYRCGVRPTKDIHRVTFGHQDDNDRFLQAMIDPITVAPWNSTFNRPKTQWEFTANAVGIYDNTAGKVFFIDMSGRSVKDICDHVIALPVEPDRWKPWTGNNLVKVMRYYNLNSDGFYSKGGVRNFVNRAVRRLFDKLKFQEYYCRFVYDGIFVIPVYDFGEIQKTKNTTTPGTPMYPECRVVAPDARAARLIGIINKTLSEDYGDIWIEKMLPALEDLNFVNIEDRVFLEGEPTQASWPVLFDYDFATESPTTEPTEEYPGLFLSKSTKLST